MDDYEKRAMTYFGLDAGSSTRWRGGKSGIEYLTCHGVFSESQVFGSKEGLLKSL